MAAATVTEPQRIRVLVVDEDPPTRKGVRLTLERAGLTVVGEASNAEAAVEAAVREQPDICLLETQIPGSGIAATAEITRQLPRTSVVMFTNSGTDEDLFDSLRVIGVRAEPPELRPGQAARLEELVINPVPPQNTTTLWLG